MHGNQRQAVLLAYLAGILDGEGCIRIGRAKKKRNPVYTAYVQVGMTDKIIPELFHQTFGGNLREERVSDRRSIWRWTCNSRVKVTEVLKAMLPFVIVKKKQIEIALDFCENFVNFRVNQYSINNSKFKNSFLHDQEIQRREELYQKMKKFNAVGAAATTEREEVERLSDSLSSWETMRGGMKSPPAILQ